jgi:hypothetical protein
MENAAISALIPCGHYYMCDFCLKNFEIKVGHKFSNNNAIRCSCDSIVEKVLVIQSED